ncbi:MAG TPA: hypothetical protein VGH19_21550 [Verrucomicrobiae bacterium]
MQKIKKHRVFILAAIFAVYLAGYGVYRCYGPVDLHWPRGDHLGPDDDYPSLLISLESPTRTLLYRIYKPCVALEDSYYYLRYHGRE